MIKRSNGFFLEFEIDIAAVQPSHIKGCFKLGGMLRMEWNFLLFKDQLSECQKTKVIIVPGGKFRLKATYHLCVDSMQRAKFKGIITITGVAGLL